MEKVLAGKPVAQAIIERIKNQLEEYQVKPVMSLIQLGSDPASAFYVRSIIKQGTKIGMDIQLSEMAEDITTKEMVCIILAKNADFGIHGIMIQKPLPKHIDDDAINNAICAFKDIDGISPINIGKLFLEQASIVPCTAAAVIELIKYYNIEISGKHVVILGRSSVVGKPLIGLLLQKTQFGNATVTICHSKTNDLNSITKTADIIIAAIGKPNFVTSGMIKPGAICLDVGINLVCGDNNNDAYVGDIDFDSCYEKAMSITPVPGGIGSVTTAILLNNLIDAATRPNLS